MSDWLLLMQQVGADDLSTSQGPLGRIYRRHSDLATERDRYKTALERIASDTPFRVTGVEAQRQARAVLASSPADPTRTPDAS